jgi:hypothetical protein
MRVLWVDDGRATRDRLAIGLAESCDVVEAASAAEALFRVCHDQPVDVVAIAADLGDGAPSLAREIARRIPGLARRLLIVGEAMPASSDAAWLAKVPRSHRAARSAPAVVIAALALAFDAGVCLR